jgi:hypothetical protein
MITSLVRTPAADLLDGRLWRTGAIQAAWENDPSPPLAVCLDPMSSDGYGLQKI